MVDLRSPYQKKRVFILELVGLLIIPMYFLDRFKTVGPLRHGLMILGLLYVLFYMRYNKFGLKDLGLQRLNLKRSGLISLGLSLTVGLITFAAITILPSLLSQGLLRLKSFPFSIPVIIFLYVIFSVPLQELLFRGYLITRLELLTKNRWVVIGLSAAIFGLAHLMFNSWSLVLFCFLTGLMWGWMFVKYRNLWTVQLSHALLGSVFIYLVLT